MKIYKQSKSCKICSIDTKLRQIGKAKTMSVSLLEVIEAGGYDLNTVEDANWLLSKRNEFDELIEKAEEVVYEQSED